MTPPLKRRDFLKSVSMAGASMALSQPVFAHAVQPTAGNHSITNNFFTASFDRTKGTLNVSRKSGAPLLSGASMAINTDKKKHLLSDGNFGHTTSSNTYRDALGSGKLLTIRSRDQRRMTDVEVRVIIYDEDPMVGIETVCKNVSTSDIILKSIEPVRAVKNEGAALMAPAVSKCITNGEMYFDTGRVHSFGTNEGALESDRPKGVHLSNQPFEGEAETIHSWWNIGLFSGYDKEGIVVGYLQNDVCLGNVLVSRTAHDQLSLIMESVYAPSLTFRPGTTVASNRVAIMLAEDPCKALEQYAHAVGTLNNARTGRVINGWCSWFYTLAQVSEQEVLSGTEFAAKHLKPYGLEYIQIDEGYQRWHGDWEGNDRFPGGIKNLADRIRGYGFKPGIWISPYVISEPTAVFREHKEWLVRNPDGTPQRVGNWPEGAEPPADEDPKRYCLDITHPGAAQWLHDLIHTIAHDWGYEMIKIDFVAWSILAAKQYHDPTVSSAQVYRKGLEIIRRAAGDKCHILECGPGAITVGLIDSMRIELDSYYGFADAAWNTYFLDPASSAAAAAQRYYFHNRTWVNDIDHVCMDVLDRQQSEAVATLIALSGGNTMSGDRLTQLDPYKLEIFKKILPAAGPGCVPIGLFEDKPQNIFSVKIKKPFGEWTVLAFFNPSLTDTIEKGIDMKQIGLDPDSTYLTFDFWKQQFAGDVKGELNVTVQPGSVSLLSVHEKTAGAQVLSTDRHVLQGAVELEDVHWNETTNTLTGISKGPLHSAHNVYVYVDGEHPWTWGGYVLFRDYDSYTLRLVDSHIIEVHVRFEKSEQVSWTIDIDDFFK